MEDRGNKRGLTPWYQLYLEPLEKPSPLPSMLGLGGGFLLFELLVVAYVRRRNSR